MESSPFFPMDSGASSETREPPRKRQRTVERELTDPTRSSSSSNAHVVPDQPSAAPGPSTSNTRSPVPMVCTGPGGNDSHVADAEVAVAPAVQTRQGPVRPGSHSRSDQSGAQSSASSMKGSLASADKGKAKAQTPTPMATLPSDTQQHNPNSAESAYRVDCDRDQMGGTDTFRHAASGAGAKPALAMAHDSQSAMQEENSPVHDAVYYFERADCVIRVEDTLFRVHRYILGRDDSAFQHMFSMPGAGGMPWQAMEGYSDDNPICLYGESVERFRALLSVFYALPHQLQEYNTPTGDVDRLLTICEMTNKYHFASTESWSVDALYNVVSGLHGAPQPQYHLSHCSSAWMKRLLDVALLCGHENLRKLVAARWVDRILARDLRPIHALEIAARSGEDTLAGCAYYTQLLEMGPDFDPGVLEAGKQYARPRPSLTLALAGVVVAAPDGEARIGTPAVLTREQKERLLAGHWSLTRLWERLRTTAPAFQRPEGCTYHQHGCLSTWAQVWRDVGRSEATLRFETADVLGRLRLMEAQLQTHADLSNALSPQCKRAALLAVKAAMAEVREGLAGHFCDLAPESRLTPLQGQA